MIAEYERAKIAERYRRGKLWRSRVGEVISWKAPYGYRRVPRGPAGPAHLEIYEPEAQVVRRVFDDYVAAGLSMRQLTRRLNADRIASPTGKPVWGVSTIGRLLRNQAYVGRAYYNRTELVPAATAGRRPTRQRPRPPTEWIAIAVPRIVADDVFEAVQRVSRDNSQWNPRRAEPGAWLLRGLVVCGSCAVGTNCHKMRGRNGTWHRYYYCRNHDPLRAGGEHRRCPERNIRADELDAFVFDQVRAALLRPQVLLAGQAAVTARQPTPDDELLGAQLARLQRKLDAAQAERRRLVDLYQAGLLELTEVGRRAAEVDARRPAARRPAGPTRRRTGQARREQSAPPAPSRLRRARDPGIQRPGLRPAPAPAPPGRRARPRHRPTGRHPPSHPARQAPRRPAASTWPLRPTPTVHRYAPAFPWWR